MTERKSPKGKQHKNASPAPTPAGNKDKVIALLHRADGATLAEITDVSGWQPHSARAVFTGLRKKGYAIEKTRLDGVNRWLITAVPA